MVITRERANELNFITTREDCVNCGICREENGKLYCDETGLCIDDTPNDVECPELDEERLRMEMTDEEYDAYRHNRLKVEEE